MTQSFPENVQNSLAFEFEHAKTFPSFNEHLHTNKVFDFDHFEVCAAEDKDNFEQAHPFSHIFYDNLFNSAYLNEVLKEFPHPKNQIWQTVQNREIQVKQRTNWQTEHDIPQYILGLVQILNSGRFLRALSTLTGINGLIPDPYYTGGGLNQILPGGELAVHVDGNWHDLMGIHRRLNVILFLNQNWHTNYKGQLEFWNQNLTQCEKAIDPLFNRLVIFKTTDFTYHGHPKPLECPDGMSRKSLILYYYTSTRPEQEIKSDEHHRAIFTRNRDLPANML